MRKVINLDSGPSCEFQEAASGVRGNDLGLRMKKQCALILINCPYCPRPRLNFDEFLRAAERREGGRRRGAGAGAQEDRRAFRLWKTEERCGGDYDGLAPEIIIMISILLPVSLSHTTPGVAPPGHPGI